MAKINSKLIAKIGILAAIYTVITLLFAPISYGQIQVRISEALTLLPFYFGPWAAIGLWIGCMIANIFGGLGLIDIIFGSLLTLIAGLLATRAHNKWTAGLYPVLINGLGVALILKFTIGLPYWITSLYVGLGEAISVYIIGIPLVGYLAEKWGDQIRG
ncbi:putative membrane protein [Halobacteroides halobius DSM 5150]|uniref:Putative membrane protein n=1 Tax=Halobacteroides halobius (strain ATCC 35273 / DSM 5150 / MD-1) TaxID=748449 RepID=L0K5Z7_HALHC|nr:QueT transporter family protein [Halobacteroides halobius]AGB40702.1 putative membrane protein [Halobacteroides halobius DSM 5150]